MHTPPMDQLIDVLGEYEAGLRRLLEMLHEERTAAIASNMDRFSGVVEKKEALQARLTALERRRVSLMLEIGADMGFPATSVLTLGQLSQQLQPPQADAILKLRQSLGALTQEIKRANTENRALVAHCLGLVRGALGFFRQITNPATVYGASGAVNSESGSGRLLSGMV